MVTVKVKLAFSGMVFIQDLMKGVHLFKTLQQEMHRQNGGFIGILHFLSKGKQPKNRVAINS
jgi:hypothetical protein